MTDESELRAAVAAGVVGSEESFRALLAAIVEVARSIFGAKASSILLLDEETEELVFEAVVGEGEDTLLGTRFPAGKGISGWVLATRTPLVIEDVSRIRASRRRRRGHGLRPEWPHGSSASSRGARARRPLGARPPRAVALQPPGDGAPRPLREPGLDRRRPAAEGAEGERSFSKARANWSRFAPRGSRRRTRGRAPRGRTPPARELAAMLGAKEGSVRGPNIKRPGRLHIPARASNLKPCLLLDGVLDAVLDGVHAEPVASTSGPLASLEPRRSWPRLVIASTAMSKA